MDKLKPSRWDTQLIYVCPNCGVEHWKAVKEVTFPGQVIICSCAATLHLQQLVNPRFVAGMPKKSEATVVPAISNTIGVEDTEKLVAKITRFSIPRKTALEMIGAAWVKHPDATVDDLLRFACDEAPPGSFFR